MASKIVGKPPKHLTEFYTDIIYGYGGQWLSTVWLPISSFVFSTRKKSIEV